MAAKLKVTQLKEVLKHHGLSTTGSKAELITRFLEADPSGEWMCDEERQVSQEEVDGDGRQVSIEGPVAGISDGIEQANGNFGIEFLEQERRRRIDALELATLRQELEIMKREMQFLRSEPQGDVSSPTASTTSGLGIRAIGELLSDFDGLNGDFLEWERQVKLVCRTYQLENMASKVLVGSKLKGRAKQWFHSRAEYIEMDLESLLQEMRTVFDSRPNKTARKQRFEARTWMASETFGEYYYEKIVLANQVPIDEDEIVDYMIDGIPNEQLRNQARIQNFETAAQLMNAFKKVTISSERVNSGSVRKAVWIDRRGNREINPKEKGRPEQRRDGEEYRSGTQRRRCFNCQGFGHLSRECPQTRRSEQRCFACGKGGHISRNCPGRSSPRHETQMSGNEHRRMVNYVVKRDQVCQPLSLDTQLDTGSAVSFMKASVVPKEYVESNRELSNEYQGLNNSPMVVQGTGNFDVEVDGRKEVDCSILLVPDETMLVPAVLGRDVLSRFKCQLTMPSTATGGAEDIGREILNIDVCEGIDNKPMLTINPEVSHQTKHRLLGLFTKEYQNVQRPSEPETKMKLKLELTNKEPFHFGPRRLSFDEKKKLTEIIDDLCRRGIIRPSGSEYASPVVLVKKRDGRLRLCVDFRVLNGRTSRDNYPLPLIEDQLDTLRGKKYYSLMDLRDGFHHIEMDEESIRFTAFVTPLGQFEYTKMPFGLKTAPSKFQRFVNTVLADLIKTCDVTVYMDDILVSTETLDAHFDVLKQVFRQLVKNRLELKIDKCKFLFTEIRYLGYLVSERGIRPTRDGVEAVEKFPIPQNRFEVQRFIGLCAYFRKFIEGFSTIAKALYQLLKKDTKFLFGEAELEAYERLKRKLVDAPILAIYNPRLETELHCDASSTGFGAVLMQKSTDAELHPIFYFSKRASETESRYHSFELETLAIVYALRRFRIYLQGIKFKIMTDCNALKLALSKKEINPRIARWALELQEYDYAVEHRPGVKMQHVDALSRVGEVLLLQVMSGDFDLAVKQSRDPVIKATAEKLEKTQDKLFEMRNGLVYRKHDGNLLFWIPAEMERNVIFQYHDQMGHFGAERTSMTILKNYWFPKLRQKVKSHVQNCLNCVSCNPPSGKVEGQLHSISKGNVPFETIHIDHYGPVDKTSAKRYVLLVVDGFTKYVRLYATKTTSSKEVIVALRGYFGHYSRPRTLVSDRGTAFTSEEFEEFLRTNDVKHVKIATGSPQANGQVERFNRTLKPMLSKLSADGSGKSWISVLDQIEFSMNNTVSRSTGETASKLLFGIDQRGKVPDKLKEMLEEENARANLEKIRAMASAKIKEVQRENEARHTRIRKRVCQYQPGDLVMIRNFGAAAAGQSSKLAPSFKGPYEVVKELRNGRYLISDPDGFQNSQRRYHGVWETANMRPRTTKFDEQL